MNMSRRDQMIRDKQGKRNIVCSPRTKSRFVVAAGLTIGFLFFVIGCKQNTDSKLETQSQLAKSQHQDTLLRSFPDQDATPSLIQLLADPSFYDGKVVTVSGVANLNHFEDYSIYLYLDDIEYGIDVNSLWLRFDESAVSPKTSPANEFHKSYISIRGRFSSEYQFPRQCGLEEAVIVKRLSRLDDD